MNIILKTIKSLVNISLRKSRTIYLSGLFWFFFASSALAQDPTQSSVKLISPIKITTAEDLLTTILEIVIIFATPFIVFFIIYAGFLYVTARGNAEQITQANRALMYAVIGGVIIIGSVAIATIVKNIVLAF